ncbi:aspartyl-phosphate phosphatase Spo0E family protein [Caloranaerobacter sp. TR13]|uniref:aspartyl-phosphate phosphatase Spo0E family protein n=1 Tax=Caloranaerobacter sp. TR13 TaxID=1302151 RepID=UPI0009EA2D26|nr:aspartyl-phosphate phosphatase Spo0E family protein [Caloranaerobacter sp. TR13]
MAYKLNGENLKKIIENKRQELNELLSKENVDKEKVLKLSMQLDELIYEYYCINKA